MQNRPRFVNMLLHYPVCAEYFLGNGEVGELSDGICLVSCDIKAQEQVFQGP